MNDYMTALHQRFCREPDFPQAPCMRATERSEALGES